MAQILSSDLIAGMQNFSQQAPAQTLSFIAGSSSSLTGDMGTLVANIPNNIIQTASALPLARLGVAFNTVQGYVGVQNACHSYTLHRQTGAETLCNDAITSAVANTARLGGGASLAASRVMSTVSAFTNTSVAPAASSLFGRATFFTGAVGGGLFGFMAACFSLLSLRGVQRALSIRSALCDAKDDTFKAAKVLARERLDTSGEKVLGKMLEQACNDIGKVRKQLDVLAEKHTAKWLTYIVEELKKNGMKHEALNLKNKGKELISKIFINLDDASGHTKAALLFELGGGNEQMKKLSTKELFGLKIAASLDEVKKIEMLSAAVGSSCAALAKEIHDSKAFAKIQDLDSEVREINQTLSALQKQRWEIENQAFLHPDQKQEPAAKMKVLDQKIENYLSRVQEIDDEKKGIVHKIKTLVETAQASVNKGILKGCLAFLASAVLVTSVAVGLAPAAGVSVLAQVVVNLVATGLGFAADLWDRKDMDDSKGAIGRYDKAFVTANIIIDVLSTAAAVAATVVLSGGMAPIALVAGLGLFWLGVSVHNYFRLTQKEREHALAHPTAQAALAKIHNLSEEQKLTGEGLVMAAKLNALFTHETTIHEAKEWLKNKIQKDKQRIRNALADKYENLSRLL